VQLRPVTKRLAWLYKNISAVNCIHLL
jgi:hypothetical protein